MTLTARIEGEAVVVTATDDVASLDWRLSAGNLATEIQWIASKPTITAKEFERDYRPSRKHWSWY